MAIAMGATMDWCNAHAMRGSSRSVSDGSGSSGKADERVGKGGMKG